MVQKKKLNLNNSNYGSIKITHIRNISLMKYSLATISYGPVGIE